MHEHIATGNLERILRETRKFQPPAWAGSTATPSIEVYRQRWQRSISDPEGFWAAES